MDVIASGAPARSLAVGSRGVISSVVKSMRTAPLGIGIETDSFSISRYVIGKYTPLMGSKYLTRISSFEVRFGHSLNSVLRDIVHERFPRFEPLIIFEAPFSNPRHIVDDITSGLKY